MNLPKSTLSRLLLVIDNSHVTPVEKAIVQLMLSEDAESTIKLMQDVIKTREMYKLKAA